MCGLVHEWKREGEKRNKRSDTNATCFVLYLKPLSSRMDCICFWGVTKTASPVYREKDALVLEDTAGLLALGARLALYAAGCLVSSIPKQGHLRAGERMRSTFLLELHFSSFFSLTAADKARYSPA